MAKGKEYELAIKISGKVDKSLKEAGNSAVKSLKEANSAISKLQNKSNWDSAFKDLDKGVSKIEKVASKAFSIVEKSAKIGGSAIVGVVGVSTKVGSDFEKQMSAVGAISNASNKDMIKLKDTAKKMGKETKFSATESGKAMEYMAMAGWKAGQMIDGIDGIMNLAAASDEDLGTVSDIVTDALTAFKMQAEDAAKFSDVLAAAASNSNTNVGMMGETFKYAAPIAGSLGYSIEDTAFAIGLLANNGIKGSQSGTQLRRIMSALVDGAKLTGKAIGQLEIKTTNADGSMRTFSDVMTDLRAGFSKLTDSEKALNAENLVGKNAMTGLLSIVNTSDSDWDKLSYAINNSAGAAKKMAEIRLDNLQGDITLLGSTAESLGISIYEDINTPMRESVQLAKGFVDNIIKWNESSGFVANISKSITKNIPTARREIRSIYKDITKMSKPLLEVGEWCLKNPTAISSVFVSIGSALLTYKVASQVYKTYENITALIGAFSNPVTAVIVGAGLIVGAIAGITTAYKEMQKNIGKKNLAEHFGDISLSLKDISQVAGYIVDGGKFKELSTAIDAFDNAKGKLKDFKDSFQDLKRLNWKIGLGMSLSAVENENYKNYVDTMLENVGAAIGQEQYAMNISLNTLFVDSNRSQELKNRFNDFYGSTQAELTKLGGDLNEALNVAFNDGLLTIDESKNLAQLQEQIAKLTNKLSSMNFEASLEISGSNIVGELDAESFRNLTQEVGNKVGERQKDIDESSIKLLQATKMQYSDGIISEEEYKKTAEEIKAAGREQKLGVASKANEILFSAVKENYNNEYLENYKLIDESINKFLDLTVDGLYKPDWIYHSGEIANGLLPKIGIDNETRQGIKQVWEEYEVLFKNELETVNKDFVEQGKAIPESISKGLRDKAMLGVIAGDVDALWYLIGDNASKNAEYEKTLNEIIKFGEDLPKEFKTGFLKEISMQAPVAELKNSLISSLNSAFLSPINLGAKININANIPGINALGNAARNEAIKKATSSINNIATKKLPGYAKGGLIQNPTIATFAEDSPEMAIPIDGSNRSLSLWKKTGEMLGAFSSTSKAENNLKKLEQNSANTGLNVTYAPVHNFNSGTPTKEDIIASNKISQKEFETMLNDVLKKNKRLSFA